MRAISRGWILVSRRPWFLLFKCLQWLPWFLLFINPYCQWQCCPSLTARQLNLFSVTMQAVDSDFNILRRWRNYSDANSDSSICSQMSVVARMMMMKKKKSLLHMVSNVQTCISVRKLFWNIRLCFNIHPPNIMALLNLRSP